MMCPSTSVRYTRHLYEFFPSGNENRIGTRTEPCGTPRIIFMCEEDSLHYTYMKNLESIGKLQVNLISEFD